jgi:hypothetical protein
MGRWTVRRLLQASFAYVNCFDWDQIELRLGILSSVSRLKQIRVSRLALFDWGLLKQSFFPLSDLLFSHVRLDLLLFRLLLRLSWL